MKKKIEEVRGPLCYRAAALEPVEGDERSFEVTFSTEEEVDQWYGKEILSHRNGAVDLKWLGAGSAPLLMDHNRTIQVGVVESASIKNRKGVATVRFGKSGLAEEVLQDVKDGIRTNISVGYRVHEAVLEKVTDDDVKIYRVTRWEPVEISIVSIPADPNAGIGRAEGETFTTRLIHDQERNDQMPDKVKEQEAASNTPAATENSDNTRHAAVASEPKASARDLQILTDAARAEAGAGEVSRIREISVLGEKMGQRDAAMEYIKEGKSVEDFQRHILENYQERANKSTPTQNCGADALGLSEQEKRSYSIARAIQAHLNGDWGQAGLEREVHQAIAKRSNRNTNGFFMPTDLPMDHLRGQRDLVAGTPSAGGYLVGEQHRPDLFIDLLVNKTKVKQLGASVMTGLQGDVSIPKLTGGATAEIVTETGAPTEQNHTFGQVKLTPRNVRAFTEMSRQLLMQSTPTVEAIVRRDLSDSVSRLIDKMVIQGSGADGQPTGITQLAGTGSESWASAPDWTDIVGLESDIIDANADEGNLAYLTTPALRGGMKTTLKSTGVAGYIWEQEAGQGYVNGYRADVSKHVPADTIIYGNWGDVMIAEWGMMEVLLNPYSKDTEGLVRMTVFHAFDTAVRHAESFAVGAKS